ncbi:MAG: hypothetical protein ACXWL2_00375 [Candidatus Chromulinivorax sp.]
MNYRKLKLFIIAAFLTINIQNILALSEAITGNAPEGSNIIINNSNTPPNAITLTFYNKQKKPLTSETTIFYGGEFIVIPQDAAFVSGYYVASDDDHTHISVLKMNSINPKKSYSLTNPNSIDSTNSNAAWVLNILDLSEAITGIDANSAPEGSNIIINNSNTPPNAITLTFYNKQKKPLTSETTIFYGGQFIVIPKNASFVSGYYVASNAEHTHIKVLKMVEINSKKSYSLTNPNSAKKRDNSNAQWIIKEIKKK